MFSEAALLCKIWVQIQETPALSRITQKSVDLRHITSTEGEFVNSLIQHLNLAHQAIKLRMYKPPEKIDADIHEFFALPIPRAIWNENRRFQDHDFIAFVEKRFQS